MRTILFLLLAFPSSALAQYTVVTTPAPRPVSNGEAAAVAPCVVIQWPSVSPSNIVSLMCDWSPNDDLDTPEVERDLMCQAVLRENLTAKQYVTVEAARGIASPAKPDQIDESTGAYTGVLRRYGPEPQTQLSLDCWTAAALATLDQDIEDMVYMRYWWETERDYDGNGSPDVGFWCITGHKETKTALERALCLKDGSCSRLAE